MSVRLIWMLVSCFNATLFTAMSCVATGVPSLGEAMIGGLWVINAGWHAGVLIGREDIARRVSP